MSQPIRGWCSNKGFLIGLKYTNLKEEVDKCLLMRFVEFYSAVQSRGCDCHLGFPISQKNTNLVENDEILLPDDFR